MPISEEVDFRANLLAYYNETFAPIAPQQPHGYPLLRSIIMALRRAAWKMFGLNAAFDRFNEQIATMRQALEVPPLFHFRAHTDDLGIFHHIVFRNGYELPDSFHADDIILDIGAHIGAFCYAALRRGCRHVYGFEADRDNFAAASANLRPFGDHVRLRHCAVWRSDRKGDQLFGDSALNHNTGGGSLLFNEDGQRMDVLAFDDILRDITHNGRQRIRLLKIDCEGSEFPILLTSSLLHLIDEIRGEFHEINDGVRNCVPIPAIAKIAGIERFTMPVLAETLEKAGFSVRSVRTGEQPLGFFVATRR